MSVRSVPCSICEGRPMQRLEERTQDGAWVYNDSLPQDLADAWIAQEGERAPLRWADAPCPRCGGAGEYEVEFMVARICDHWQHADRAELHPVHVGLLNSL